LASQFPLIRFGKTKCSSPGFIYLPLFLAKDFIPKYVLNHGNYNIVATYNLLYNASLMVREGIGYALCLDKLVNTDCMSELCFRPL